MRPHVWFLLFLIHLSLFQYINSSNDEPEENLSTELFSLIISGKEDQISALLQRDKSHLFLTMGPKKFTPLHFAAQQGLSDGVKILLEEYEETAEEGVNTFEYVKEYTNRRTTDGMTAVHSAAVYGHLQVIKELSKRGASLDVRSDDDITPLHLATVQGHIKLVEYFLLKGLDANAKDINGSTPLHVACVGRSMGVLDLLIDNGKAQVDAVDSEGFTPLMRCILNTSPELTKKLVTQYNAAINITNNEGYSPLYLAIQQKQRSVIQILLKKRANVNMCNKNGFCPIHKAAELNFLPVCKVLIQMGANVNSASVAGVTPLQLSLSHFHFSLSTFLVDSGANVETTNLKNESAFDLLVEAIKLRYKKEGLSDEAVTIKFGEVSKSDEWKKIQVIFSPFSYFDHDVLCYWLKVLAVNYAEKTNMPKLCSVFENNQLNGEKIKNCMSTIKSLQNQLANQNAIPDETVGDVQFTTTSNNPKENECSWVEYALTSLQIDERKYFVEGLEKQINGNRAAFTWLLSEENDMGLISTILKL